MKRGLREHSISQFFKGRQSVMALVLVVGLTACQAMPPVDVSTPASSPVVQPAVQARAPIEGPAIAAPQVGTGPAAESPWKAALSPYLWQSTVAESREAPRPVPPIPQTAGTRVALLLPLSGRHARLGQAMLDAATLAMFDFGDERLELVVQDTRGTAEGAEEAARLVVGDGARVILGPLLAPSVRAAAPTALAAGVPIIAFSSDRTVVAPGVYTMGFLPGVEVRAVVQHAASRGMIRFGLLAPDDAYGATVSETFAQVVGEMGGVITRTQFYDPFGADFSEAVKAVGDFALRRQALLEERARLETKTDEASIKALERLEDLQTIGDLPFDALLVADGGKRLQTVAANLPYFDVDPAVVKMLGTGQWDEAGLGAEPALLGGWYAAPPPESRAGFEARFVEQFGERPPRLATLSYDASALAAVLSRQPNGPDFSDAVLTNPSGWTGRDGIFRFNPDGLVERGLAVLEVGRRSNRIIAAPPITFQPAIN